MRHPSRLAAAFALALALGLGLAALGQAAAAQEVEPLTVYGHAPRPGSEMVSVGVPYGDLNLTTYRGADIMLGRLRSAAKTICGVESANPIDRATLWRPCVEEIVWRAVGDFGNPLVADLNDRRTGAYTVASADW